MNFPTSLSLKSPGVQTGLIAAGLVGAIAVVYALGGSTPSDGTAAAGVPAAEAPPPSADNVDPSFHAQVMTLQRAADEAPGDTARLIALARFQQDGHQYEDAVASYERLLDVAPQHRQARLDLAFSLAELQRWDDALDALGPLLDADPDDPKALYNVGAIHANQGSYAEARTVWARVQAQTRDAALAQQAALSLQQLAQLEATGAPPPGAATPASGPAMAGRPAAGRPAAGVPAVAGRSGAPMPAGHPPIAGRPAASATPVEAVPVAGGAAPATRRPASRPAYQPAVAGGQ